MWRKCTSCGLRTCFGVLFGGFSVGLAVVILNIRQVNSSTGADVATFFSLRALNFLMGAGGALLIRAHRVIRNNLKERKDLASRRPSELSKENCCAVLENLKDAENKMNAFLEHAWTRE